MDNPELIQEVHVILSEHDKQFGIAEAHDLHSS